MKTSILDRGLKYKREVSQSAFQFLFSEIVQHCLRKAGNDGQELERQLEELGYPLGPKFLEAVCFRDRNNKKETTIIGMLRFIHGDFWKALFGKTANDIEQNVKADDEYMISEYEPSLCNQYAALPRNNRGEINMLNCGAFVAGILEGMLNSANFPSRVTAHTVIEGTVRKTVYLIKFAPEVINREINKRQS